jgi:hypothetical protein
MSASTQNKQFFEQAARDNGNTAFPVTEEHGANSPHFGMTLRDYFATNAMQGQIAYSPDEYIEKYTEPKEVARIAYAYADAMLAERGKV